MRVFIIAGEPSGDKLGGALMRGLRQLRPDVAFEGIGGADMQEQGLQSLFPMEELSVMGIAEILPKYRSLMARINETAAAVVRSKPDVLITIDSPDFCLRVARRVKSVSRIRTVHYVAPTVWAWRAGRAKKMAQVIDQVLALFPFEPPLMSVDGMVCDFVGHPVVAEPRATPEEVSAFRAAHEIGTGPMLLVLPGSRRGEVARLASVFGQSIASLKAQHEDLKVVVPAAAPVVELVRAEVSKWPVNATVLDPRGMSLMDAGRLKRAAFQAGDIALAASGTVSLELAAARTPMVIAYKMNWLSFRLIKAMALVDTVTLVNLVSDTRVVPDFLGPECQPDRIAEALLGLLRAPEAQLAAMEVTMQRLGEGGEDPGLRAAKAVLARL
ncbi:Lipid-A-disaccharide synthase [Roseobacter fucihabitans]|uniref:Lipid-A-disaccharide synthase n=1 Tax=Roseobacter fucihabitans TaxID=1537242 RepID=A0ABZ2BU53_9RHOB|nr:lipid-A-disaccharide synthase [Roseobacter litoralis]MBC6965744.1 Lipid-A-disaccharide synthase [Roseobacter litoralis]